MSAICTKNN